MLLFGLTMAEYKDDFDQAARDLQSGGHNLVIYQGRHGGASRDILLQRRDLEEMRKRGQWKTYSSLRRYEESGRLQKVLQTTAPELLRYCQAMEQHILEVLLGPSRGVPCPPWGCAGPSSSAGVVSSQ